jgi:hypothetical protein
MLISHKHKFITIDIPKTGSRSLRESLYPMGIIDVVGKPYPNEAFYQHGTALDCVRDFEKNNCNFHDYYSFCVVRNPWDRYFSFFKYFKNYAEKYMRRDESITWGPVQVNQGKMCVDLFRDRSDVQILRNIISNHTSQDSYYCDENGEIIVNHIAEFENLQNEFVFLCNQVGINPPTLQHGNKSANSLNMHDIYNQQLINLVANKEKSVIELKGYEI